MGAAVTKVSSVKQAVDGVLSPEAQTTLLQAGGVGLGVFLAGGAFKSAVSGVGEALDKGLKAALLGAGALAVAGKVLDLY